MWSITVAIIQNAIQLKNDGDSSPKVIYPGVYIIKYPNNDGDVGDGHTGHQLRIPMHMESCASDVPLIATEIDYGQFWDETLNYFEQNVSQSIAFNLLKNSTNRAFLRILENGKYDAEKLYSEARHKFLLKKGGPINRGDDCQNLIKKLFDTSAKDPGSFMRYSVDSTTNSFQAAFYATSFMVKMSCILLSLVVFDTTHCTNLLNIYLGLFCAEDSFGDTVVTSWCYLSSQDTETFQQIMTWYIEMINEGGGGGGSVYRFPKILMTDQDPAIALAISLVFPSEMVHLLCAWYIIEKNAKKNLRGHICGTDLEVVISRLWKFAMMDDLSQAGDEIMEAQFREIISYVNGHVVTQRSRSEAPNTGHSGIYSTPFFISPLFCFWSF